MDRITSSCAVYIDDRVKSERWLRRPSETGSDAPEDLEEPEDFKENATLFLSVFGKVYLCNTGKTFASKLAELNEGAGSECAPIFAIFDVGFHGGSNRRTGSLSADTQLEMSLLPPNISPYNLTFSSQSEESYGLQLLSRVSADLQVQEGPKLIIPIAILRSKEAAAGSSQAPEIEEQSSSQSVAGLDSRLIARCLDAGATDVLTAPLHKSRVEGLVVHGYRVHKAALKELSGFLASRKLRKQSWVGVHDQQPYAYLREAMVSKLMKGICNPEEVVEDFQDRDLYIIDERKPLIEAEIGKWGFSAHDFSEDELVYAACKMLDHALNIPELDYWRLTADELRTFLLASRASYNSFVLYHNFRHAVDVLQSVFYFLLQIGALPPYLGAPLSVARSPISTLLKPFDALTLLIAAIGHDVGHPGVNNVFLVKLNAPLAQLYNDSSVLEAFHCAAFSQILRRHWPAAFKDYSLRKLLISSILATDMGVHQTFMQRLGNLQEKYHENHGIEGWKQADLDTYKALACGLLIKCADISNVARPWEIAKRWTNTLQEEFANQGEMEKEVGMETALFGGPPELGNLLKLATGQINFMAIFASPLFDGVADLLPQMSFAATQIKANKSVWQDLIEYEKRKESLHSGSYRESAAISPRARSPAIPPPPGPPQVDGGSDCPSLSDFPSPKEPASASAPSNLTYQASQDSISRPGTSAASSVDQSHQESEESDPPYPPTHVGVAARKSSSAIPGLTVMPPAQTNHGPSNLSHSFDFGLDGAKSQEEATTQRDYLDQGAPQVTTNSHQDSPILAAVIYASNNHENTDPSVNTRRRTENEDVSPYGSPPCGLVQNPPTSNTRHYSSHAGYGNHNHHSHHMSTTTSAPSTLNRNSQANSGATTQSSNTVMTPISPSTQGTSFLSPDATEEKEYPRRGYGARGNGYGNGNGYDYDSGNDDDLAYHSESRPTSAGIPPMGGSMPAITSSLEQNGHYSYHHHLKHQHSEEASKTRRFTRPPTSVMGSPNGNGNGNGHGNGLTSSHSHGSSIVRVSSGHGSAFGSDMSGSTSSRNVPRRRSRLRLAFWRRNKHSHHVDDW
ncbi:3',5'-cyclic-nucleotide phosphodiesterase [Arachnomyces sp. PD_36]|nr:3',5'-cyclic-nucleotide phosphodiesterase [Arachnomyces sp. PD_36]